jgi:hypothetical protein
VFVCARARVYFVYKTIFKNEFEMLAEIPMCFHVEVNVRDLGKCCFLSLFQELKGHHHIGKSPSYQSIA